MRNTEAKDGKNISIPRKGKNGTEKEMKTKYGKRKIKNVREREGEVEGERERKRERERERERKKREGKRKKKKREKNERGGCGICWKVTYLR